jgi:hypothetical protein
VILLFQDSVDRILEHTASSVVVVIYWS